MGQAIIVRASGGYNSNGGSGEDKNIIGWQPKTEIITTNSYFTVPKAKDQEFFVRIFGGGGGAGDDRNYAFGRGGYKEGQGYGGIYGGNGAGSGGTINNGTNTLGIVGLEFTGPGIMDYWKTAGGGYGGCGGSSCGGGGGYGANGGNANESSHFGGATTEIYKAAGGGGGYGGHGGDGISNNFRWQGGYGGGYGPENYGRGGGSGYDNGKSGICIITYQAPIYKT